jgi:hypothetical protein
MAITRGYTFGATEQVTNSKLHSLVDSATISSIVNNDVDANAQIAETKISFDGSTVCKLATTQTVSGNKTFSGTTDIYNLIGSLASLSTINNRNMIISSLASITNIKTNLICSSLASIGSLSIGNVLPVANLGTGTPSSSNYLRGDGAWVEISIPTDMYRDSTIDSGYGIHVGASSTGLLTGYGDEAVMMAIDGHTGHNDFSKSNGSYTLTSMTDADIVDMPYTATNGYRGWNFDGDNDYITIADDANYSGMATWTLEIFVYKDTTGTQYIMDEPSEIIEFCMGDASLQLIYKTSSETGHIFKLHGLPSSGTGAWLYLVATYDSATSCKLYANAVELISGSDVNFKSGALKDSAGFYLSGNSGHTALWNGKMGAIRMLNRVLSQAEITARYQKWFD